MKDRLAARRYAKALFHLARDAGRVETIRADMRTLAALFRASDEFRRFNLHPRIPSAHRRSALGELLASRLDPLTLRFLMLLEDKRRLSLLESIGPAFDDLFYDFKRILRVTVTSARPLSDQHAAALMSRLSQKFEREIEAAFQVDASLLGGFRVQAGDAIYDASVSTQLIQVQRQLIHA